jgi:colanic acid biosynthesis glycosyl transferase WcaI
MKRSILVHDYAGYPFTLQLAELFAAQGATVVYCHFTDLQLHKAGCQAATGARGRLRIQAISLGVAFQKDSLLKRRKQDLQYARLLCDVIRQECPALVLSANTPLEVQLQIQRTSRECGARFYFWMQDFYSLAVQRLLPRKLPVFGHAVGWYYELLEKRLLRAADGNILITEDFCPMLQRWRVDSARCTVIENWAPLIERASHEEASTWLKQNDLVGKKILLYTGTLGMKHNPRLLVALAQGVASVPEARVVVVSAGAAATWICEEARKLGLRNLRVLPFQPVAQLPAMLAAASVLLCVLEPDAGAFSVPSKILSYLVAGRPILAAIPQGNLGYRIVTQSGAGAAIDPTNEQAFVAAGLEILRNPECQSEFGAAGRRYAEEHFVGDKIVQKFRHALGVNGGDGCGSS